jgi:hypothetical protein
MINLNERLARRAAAWRQRSFLNASATKTARENPAPLIFVKSVEATIAQPLRISG